MGKNILTDLIIDASITADTIIKSGGTSSQFLKADGSIDSTSYGVGTVTQSGSPISGYISTFSSSGVITGTSNLTYALGAGLTTIGSAQDAIRLTSAAGSVYLEVDNGGGNVVVVGDNITADAFVKSAGTSSQFLMANGSVISNIPVTALNSGTSANATTYWRGDGVWSTVSAAAPATSTTANTGTVISLANNIGNYCNMASANATTTYTVSGSIAGGFARVLINTTSKPTVTTGTEEQGAAWLTGTDMYLDVYYDGTNVKYYFISIASGSFTGVTKVGTPLNNQIGVWTGDGTLEGDPDLTYNSVQGQLNLNSTNTYGIGGFNAIRFNVNKYQFGDTDGDDLTTEINGFGGNARLSVGDGITTLTGNLTGATSTITAQTFVKQGGTAAQFLKADGTTDSSTYLTSVGIADLTATGTPSATTYLRGDNTWATAGTGGTAAIARFRSNASQNADSTSDIAIQWDISEEKDTGFTHSTSLNNSRIEVDESGNYTLMGAINYTGTTNNYRFTGQVSVRINGVTTLSSLFRGGYVRATSGAIDGSIPFLINLKLTAGDYVEILSKRISTTPGNAVVTSGTNISLTQL